MVFSKTSINKEKIIGGKNIATTFFEGKRISQGRCDDEIHVFVSKDKSKLLEAKKFGWYPLVTNNRSINRPYINGVRFGECLGYPDCCIDFFRIYNNWHLYNCPYEIYKKTPKIHGKSAGSYYCNNFLMDSTYSYIHHFPCSYKCKKTIEFAKKIERKILEVEPEFVYKTGELLKKPLLVFNERNFILFDGVVSRNNNGFLLNYGKCQYFSNAFRQEENIDFFDSIQLGNHIIMDENNIIIKEDNSIIKEIKKKPDWFLVDFD